MAEAQPAFIDILSDIFPRTSQQVLNNVIQIVEEGAPFDSFEQKIETMINMLSGDGAQGPLPNVIVQVDPDQQLNVDALLTNLISIYPDVDENYLHRYISDKADTFDLQDAIEELSSMNLPRKVVDPIVIADQLRAALPNADPSYLQREARRLAECSPRELDEFLQTAIENNEYPTMEEYLKTKKHNDKVAAYKENFDLKKFLEDFPDPFEKFADPKRPLCLDENSEKDDEKYALNFLYNQYRFVRKKYIDVLFGWEKKNLVAICDRLERLNRSLRKPRPVEEKEDSTNIELLQLITFLKHRKLIKRELKSKDEHYRQAKEEARAYNLLETCQCCFDDELIPEECYFCMKGCVFCKGCIQKGVEVGVGRGDVHFPCMAECNSEFSLQTLQMVLPKKLFKRLAQKIASEEIKNAKVDGLDTCPFCDFAMILPKYEKIFKCINEECGIESCRQCRHKSHIPLRCNEIEYDEDVRRRTFIENKMTEALTRTCYKCKKSFIKDNGCNKMTCTCGAKMCYLCGQAVVDYSHFGNEAGKCHLTTNDIEINLERVIRGAEAAKRELGNVEIKFDPATNIRDFFR